LSACQLQLPLALARQPELCSHSDKSAFCRRPVVSQIYERGWRQGFAWAGFPGVEREFSQAMNYLRPQYGETLVDMSCGSGLFARRFARSGRFDSIIACDFSESMLRQTQQLIKQDGSIDTASVLLLRADVARLPFQTGSLSAMHAGVHRSALVVCITEAKVPVCDPCKPAHPCVHVRRLS
jgi:SAM-dependent methyltransferase